MPTADQARIAADRARPRITELWWALRPLTSVIRFMQTGAHPDDEISGMLAGLAFRDGINISYACSTRGEGGQNDIGQEAGPALGALRTREMERACDILAMRMYWHSETPDDPITDFGFSKSGTETLGYWGRDRTLARFVDIIRLEKPDIICPTFLDVPGQHGHHRAMTELAHDVMSAAADPDYPSNRAPWQVKKLYLPAWSGAGQAYDDDLPPPAETMRIEGLDRDPVTGWAWDRIGQQSRAYHRTQGMGRWVPDGQTRDWPLHLAQTHLDGPDDAITAGLPNTLADLAALDGASLIAPTLIAAQAAIDDAIAAFPATDRVAQFALNALASIREARATCPEALQNDIAHRLAAKETQLGHVIRVALGVEVRGRVADPFLKPGATTDISVEHTAGQAESLQISFDLPDGWRTDGQNLIISEATAPTAPYRTIYDPQNPDTPACIAHISHGGTTLDVRCPFEDPPVILPPWIARATPDAGVLNLATQTRSISGRVADIYPERAKPGLDVPDGWTVRLDGPQFQIEAPKDVPEGLYTCPVHLCGNPSMTVQQITHDHTAPTAFAQPATVRLLALNADLPDVRIGYVGAGNDRVNHWLARVGADVTDVTDADLARDDLLAGYDTIVIGIFALRFRTGLATAMPALHRWAQAGGTLITLYHRPWDNWDPELTPPHRLEIGQPSLRWRVTDQTAPVRHLCDHPLLSTPNPIGPADWDGWVKERGLYFAKSWDAAYTPLLEMADPDEAPHQGALLVADVGKGRHIHTSLILHHQMENLVPGAFRLMANLTAKRG